MKYVTASVHLLQDALQPVNASVRRTAVSVSNFLQNKPNLDVAVPGNKGAQSWLLTTYLDDVSTCPDSHCMLAVQAEKCRNSIRMSCNLACK